MLPCSWNRLALCIVPFFSLLPEEPQKTDEIESFWIHLNNCLFPVKTQNPKRTNSNKYSLALIHETQAKQISM